MSSLFVNESGKEMGGAGGGGGDREKEREREGETDDSFAPFSLLPNSSQTI